MAAVDAITVTLPYSPRAQQRTLHSALDQHRWVVAVCHRRMGKTVLAVNQLIKCALTCQKSRPRFAYIAPFRNQAKDIAWAYLKHYTAPIPGRDVNESELRIDLPNGSQVRIYGADNQDALRGIYLDGVVLDEYGQMSDSLWGEVIRPLLSDREGWAFFIGTPNGRNQFYEAVKLAQKEQGWFYVEYKASQTMVLPYAELEDAKRTMTVDQYQQEYECSFEAAVKGAVYAREMAAARSDGRIAPIPWEPRVPVDTSWDLGMDDSTAIWFSQSLATGEVRFLAYYENSGHGLHHYVGLLKEQQAKYGWSYGDHFLPHDVDVKELGTGVSRLETLRSMGLFSVMPIKRTENLYDDINAVRMFLPRCWFSVPACEQGVEALMHYRWKEQTEHQTGKTLPVHDFASHGADALRTLACAPARKPKLMHQWNQQNRDHDPADRRLGKGKYRTQGVGRRGGW